MRFWLGGYTADMEGAASGIGTLVAGSADDGSAAGALSFTGTAAGADSPSWIAQHPSLEVVYAALESAQTVAAFVRTGEGTLAPLGRPVEAGVAVCHVAVAPDGGSLIACCWGDGRVVRIPLGGAGQLHEPSLGAAAADPFAGPVDPFADAVFEVSAGQDAAVESELAAAARSLRSAVGDEFAAYVPGYDLDGTEEPTGGVLLGGTGSVDDVVLPDRVSRAHAALFLPDGRIATTDLGFDLVRIWRPAADGLRLDHDVVLPRGTGPRHMVLHPSGHLHVVTEYTCEVFTLGAGADGRWRLLGGIAASALRADDDSAAELARSRDGEFLYAGLRGSNTIATLRVRGAGERVEQVGLADAGVDWPRHHVIVRDTVLVAGQRSDDVVSLTLDARTGVPGRVRHRTEAPTPTCILPVR
ncbi:6-phosphogluconolactonase, cycloisomerase 2 family [Microbacterium sp. cf046]|uniref:lactonase family protein n=1 Tax=Microbacterium sp. cf046 TaxID=1761803 RepID=UPI0008DF1A8F|nr:beta-propeller fold lactonase family protein [Microbacterium sp. cf046]SFR88792.1 6-phosphogluconolactonase, cycloisomerase 2 family [Microbacterium sp. cf046]